MTATSVDGSSAQRQVVAGRLVPDCTVKGGAEGVDGVALEAEPDVGVDGGGDADVGVAEEFLDHDEFDAFFVCQLSPRDQFLKRYNEGLEEMAAQRRAGEEAVRLSGKSDDEVTAELAAAEERFAKAGTEFEAATAHRDAMRAVMEQRKRLSGNYNPEETVAKAQRLHDRLNEGRRRR